MHEAKTHSLTVSDLVSRGIEKVLRDANVWRDPEVRRRAREAAGKFRGPADLSARRDDYFAEAREE